MYNDRLSNEEARERITQRTQEAESYSLQKRLGIGRYRISRWILIFIVLASMVMAAELLF